MLQLMLVSKSYYLSTDKASSPINLYGATKLAQISFSFLETHILALNKQFSVVRAGLLWGQRLIIPFLLKRFNYS